DLSAHLGDPMQMGVIGLVDRLHALHEVGKLLKLRPLVVDGADRLVDVDVLCDRCHVESSLVDVQGLLPCKPGAMRRPRLPMWPSRHDSLGRRADQSHTAWMGRVRGTCWLSVTGRIPTGNPGWWPSTPSPARSRPPMRTSSPSSTARSGGRRESGPIPNGASRPPA